MPTYRIILDSSTVPEVVVEAAIIDFSNPDCVTLLDEDDEHIIAAVPKAKLLYIMERKKSSRKVTARA